tara:strand:+ start:291 stop:467 length:177 start_codon:yes stop_codon:yes gene_type:complete
MKVEDEYVYISVKLNLLSGQTEESIAEIIQEMHYSFKHSQITETEIRDVIDMQIKEEA